MPPRQRVAVPVVQVDGSELPLARYDDLIDVRVEQSVHVPDMFSLRFRDPNFEMLDSDAFVIGAAVDISVVDQQAEVVLTKGEITAVGVEQGGSGRHELVVSGLGRGHRLGRGPKARTFTNMTDSDIVSQIAREAGLTADVDSTDIIHEYLLQAGTDYAFVSERARAVGFDWWISDRTLYFKSSANNGAGPTLTFGEDLVKFKVRASCAEAGSEVNVRGWDPEAQQAIIGNASMTSGNGLALGTDASLATKAVDDAATFGSSIFRGTGTVGVKDTTEANLLAQSLAAWATSEYVSAKGEALGNSGIQAGLEVTVAGVGTRLAGKYLLTSVEHVLGLDRDYVTRFTAGGKQPDTLVDLLAGPPLSAATWGEKGLVIGIVTNNKDPEGNGRIKVKFPTFSDEEESWWARVAAIGAGPTRGLSVLYEINDEVLVAFEHGDVRRPIVLGGLWSGQKRPHQGGKETDNAGVAARTWRSRTGHTIAMNDSATPASSFISITLADTKTILRMGEDKVTLDAPTDISITSETNITIKATADLTLEGQNVTIKATKDLSMEGLNIKGKASTQMNLEGTQATVKGSATATLEGGGTANVKGAIVKLN